jgi:hypothetical protein
MKISTILDHIDSGHMALPEFQRGYVWNREQVRGLFDSLYRKHPVGGLLVWATESQSAAHRGDGTLAAGIVKLLLDGQQRMTSLYGVVRGVPPKFFDGNAQAFTGLRFHLEDQVFEFFQPVKMAGDPLWIDVTALMKAGMAGLGASLAQLQSHTIYAPRTGDYAGRMANLLSILDKELHIEEVTGADKSLEVVVDIFNRVNSGGTKLSKGDLALARICADWPEARDTMKDKLAEWDKAGYAFNLDWLLRSVNTVLTGEARFQHLQGKGGVDIREGLARSTKHIDTTLNLISGRLGLDHDRVFFGRYAVPLMVRYLDRRASSSASKGPGVSNAMGEVERDKLLFWFIQAAMWGRFSGSTESYLDQDLAALEGPDGGLDPLLERLRLWHGSLRVEPGNFSGSTLGARFYPVLYMLTRMGDARDWGSGLALKAGLLGKMSQLEVHHIFPKAQLRKRNWAKGDINALANFCFLTKDTNLAIRDRLPEVYFREIEEAHPGALASQWIPADPELWRMERFGDFLEARKVLLAAELNRRLEELLHGDTRWLDRDMRPAPTAATPKTVPPAPVGGVDSQEEEAEFLALRAWMEERGLAPGELGYELVDDETGTQRALLDLAWPDGLPPGLGERVAVLLYEGEDTIRVASQAGFRCFTDVDGFKRHVETEVLGGIAPPAQSSAA